MDSQQNELYEAQRSLTGAFQLANALMEAYKTEKKGHRDLHALDAALQNKAEFSVQAYARLLLDELEKLLDEKHYNKFYGPLNSDFVKMANQFFSSNNVLSLLAVRELSRYVAAQMRLHAVKNKKFEPHEVLIKTLDGLKNVTEPLGITRTFEAYYMQESDNNCPDDVLVWLRTFLTFPAVAPFRNKDPSRDASKLPSVPVVAQAALEVASQGHLMGSAVLKMRALNDDMMVIMTEDEFFKRDLWLIQHKLPEHAAFKFSLFKVREYALLGAEKLIDFEICDHVIWFCYTELQRHHMANVQLELENNIVVRYQVSEALGSLNNTNLQRLMTLSKTKVLADEETGTYQEVPLLIGAGDNYNFRCHLAPFTFHLWSPFDDDQHTLRLGSEIMYCDDSHFIFEMPVESGPSQIGVCNRHQNSYRGLDLWQNDQVTVVTQLSPVRFIIGTQLGGVIIADVQNEENMFSISDVRHNNRIISVMKISAQEFMTVSLEGQVLHWQNNQCVGHGAIPYAVHSAQLTHDGETLILSVNSEIKSISMAMLLATIRPVQQEEPAEVPAVYAVPWQAGAVANFGGGQAEGPVVPGAEDDYEQGRRSEHCVVC